MLQDILNIIPGVSIREFLPDTRLDQCINMFTDLISNMAKLFTDDKDKSSSSKAPQGTDAKSENGLFKKITAATWYTMKYMVGATDPSFFSDLKESMNDSLPFANYNQNMVNNTKSGTSMGFYVMTFPYTLYYRLQSCVTTNIYEVPGVSDNKLIFSSNGSAGWTDGGDMMSAGGFRLSGLLNKIPLIGSLANMVLGNIGINYMPWWNAESGSKTKDPEITIKFDLFNDSADAAMMNFIFVNTLIPNNRWIQYNMFQHSSSLYDVKIEGINRLFACAGDFTVTYEGVLRDPPQTWIHKLATNHLNQNMEKGTFEKNALANRIIKIPDVYRVEMKFQSLLPANFNNFIFAYAQNINHMDEYGNGKNTYQESTFATTLPKAISKYTEHVTKVWNAGDSSAADKIEQAENAKKASQAKQQQYNEFEFVED